MLINLQNKKIVPNIKINFNKETYLEFYLHVQKSFVHFCIPESI